MSPRQWRGAALFASLSLLAGATVLVLRAMDEHLVFFYTPSQVAQGEVPQTQRLRLGGLVEAGSHLRQAQGLHHLFRVTDLNRTIPVEYSGTLPDLFQEGKGVVVEGRLTPGGTFQASLVLAKHDENYVPPEVARSLAQGQRAKNAPKDTAKDAPGASPASPEPHPAGGAP